MDSARGVADPESLDSMRTVLLLGSPGVGKTALMERFVHDRFVEVYTATTGTCVCVSTQHRGASVTLRIRDLGGDAFCVRDTAGVDGYFLVYSVTSRASLDALVYLHDTVLRSCVGSPTAIPRVLVGMRADVEDDARQVMVSEGRALAARWQCPFVECSAKDGTNVARAFSFMLDEIAAGTNGPTREASLSRRASRSKVNRDVGVCAACCSWVSRLFGLAPAEVSPLSPGGSEIGADDGLTLTSPSDLRRGLLVLETPTREYSFSPAAAGSLHVFTPEALAPELSPMPDASPYAVARRQGGLTSPTSQTSWVQGIQLAPLPGTGHPVPNAAGTFISPGYAAPSASGAGAGYAPASAGSGNGSLRAATGSAPTGARLSSSTPAVGSSSSVPMALSSLPHAPLGGDSAADGSSHVPAGFVAVTGADGQQYLMSMDNAAALLLMQPRGVPSALQELPEETGSTGGTPHTDTLIPMRQAVLSLQAAAASGAHDLAPLSPRVGLPGAAWQPSILTPAFAHPAAAHPRDAAVWPYPGAPMSATQSPATTPRRFDGGSASAVTSPRGGVASQGFFRAPSSPWLSAHAPPGELPPLAPAPAFESAKRQPTSPRPPSRTISGGGSVRPPSGRLAGAPPSPARAPPRQGRASSGREGEM